MLDVGVAYIWEACVCVWVVLWPMRDRGMISGEQMSWTTRMGASYVRRDNRGTPTEKYDVMNGPTNIVVCYCPWLVHITVSKCLDKLNTTVVALYLVIRRYFWDYMSMSFTFHLTTVVGARLLLSTSIPPPSFLPAFGWFYSIVCFVFDCLLKRFTIEYVQLVDMIMSQPCRTDNINIFKCNGSIDVGRNYNLLSSNSFRWLTRATQFRMTTDWVIEWVDELTGARWSCQWIFISGCAELFN